MSDSARIGWCGGVATLLTRVDISPDELAERWLVHPDLIRFWCQVGDTFRDVSADRALMYMRAMSPGSGARSPAEMMGHMQSCTCLIDAELNWMLEG